MVDSSREPSGTEDGSDDDEWRFGLDEVGPEAAASEPTIEPEAIDTENALFFLLGVGLFVGLVVFVVL
jgi:hypothetical protein